MYWIDTHVHFHFPDYDADRTAVIEASVKAGIRQFINVGTDVKSSEASLDLARKYSFIYAAAGLHPHDAKDGTPEVMKNLSRLLRESKMVAIGEIGLDYFRDHSPRSSQIKVFEQFLEIYKEIQKPLILHCRDAYQDLYEILKAFGSAPYKGVMHCYSSDRETMYKFLDLGFLISFAGPLTYKKNDVLRDACQACPSDRIVFETDGPFLPPQSKRGSRNESLYMLETVQKAAEVRNTSLEKLAEISSANAARVFGFDLLC